MLSESNELKKLYKELCIIYAFNSPDNDFLDDDDDDDKITIQDMSLIHNDQSNSNGSLLDKATRLLHFNEEFALLCCDHDETENIRERLTYIHDFIYSRLQ